MRAHRSFNRNSFGMGGRVYGPWQNMWSKLRRRLKLNGREVVELDFSAMHAFMLYALYGRRCPSDPYRVTDTRFSRPEGKIAFMIMVNARDRETAVAAIAFAFDWSLKTASRLYHEVVHRNRAIEEAFGSDAGIRLMNDDSRICIRVVTGCIERGIPCLPVHDSFIVPADEAATVRGLMDEAMAAYKRSCRVPAREDAARDWTASSSPDLHSSSCSSYVRVPVPACVPAVTFVPVVDGPFLNSSDADRSFFEDEGFWPDPLTYNHLDPLHVVVRKLCGCWPVDELEVVDWAAPGGLEAHRLLLRFIVLRERRRRYLPLDDAWGAPKARRSRKGPVLSDVRPAAVEASTAVSSTRRRCRPGLSAGRVVESTSAPSGRLMSQADMLADPLLAAVRAAFPGSRATIRFEVDAAA